VDRVFAHQCRIWVVPEIPCHSPYKGDAQRWSTNSLKVILSIDSVKTGSRSQINEQVWIELVLHREKMLLWLKWFVDFSYFCDLSIDRTNCFEKAIIGRFVDIVQTVDNESYVLVALNDLSTEHVGDESQKCIVVTTRRHNRWNLKTRTHLKKHLVRLFEFKCLLLT